MWSHFALLLIIGAAFADHDHAWKTGKEYQYHVHSRTLTYLDELTKEYAGILMKSTLTIQATSSDTLQAVITKPKYARVHQALPEGWTSDIPKEKLEPRELPMSGKPFTIKLKHGVIRDLLVEKDVPTWEINLLKSIVSQLQVDTQGENRIRSKSIQIPDDEQPFASFRAMEDSVGSKCEVLYDIMPLSESTLYDKPELVPLPDLREDGHHFDIMKTKNYSRCEQRMAYHFGIGGKMTWAPISPDGYNTRTSMSRVIISGKLKQFTIQSSATVETISVNQNLYTGIVNSRINVTLDKMDKISNSLLVSEDLVSTGNLVYIYNKPCSESRKHASPSIGRNSLPVLSSESKNLHSSSEERHEQKDPQDSSSESSISIANSNERSYLQSKPSLDQVPDNPLLPYFVGYKGKTIDNAEEINTVEAAAHLIRNIPEDIEYSRLKSLSHGMLEKFTILTKLMRTMNSKQIAEVQEKVGAIINEISESDIEAELKNYYSKNFWDILRDAVAQLGTGPAFLTIRDWIQRKKIEGAEAARIISRLPKTMRTPTTELIQAFFELITEPIVTQQRFLNVSAPLAFAELVFYTQVSHRDHFYRYPIFVFGRMTPKDNRAVVETYIPYMAKQLKEAIKDGDSPRIQTYITALGNFGHPKILSVFEPYLEGTVPISTMQRMLMVTSLYRLAEINPKLARSVAYKIYLNVREADDVRTAAVFVVMKTNPPLVTLQRMAAFTNRDDSKQVNSAVTSVIESLAQLEDSEWQDLSNKARIAKTLLKPAKYSTSHSRAEYKKFVLGNMIYRIVAYIIGSDDSDLPKAEYVNMDISYGAFKLPVKNVGWMVSSMKQLLNIWDMLDDEDDEHKPSAVEKIVRALDIQPEEPLQLEGNFFYNTIYEAGFYPFDNHTVESLVNMLTTKFAKAMEPGLIHFDNTNHLESYDVTVGVPTETGLPFMYSMEAPRLVRFSNEGKFNIKPMEGFTTDLNMAGHFVWAASIQNRIGFLTPFEHHQYIAGVDQNVQLFLPFGFEVKFEPAKKNIQVKLHPDNYYKYGFDMITLAGSVIPYTSTYNILDLQPVLLDKGTQYAYIRKPQETELSMIDNIHIMASSDIIKTEEWSQSGSEVWKNFLTNNAHYKLINVVLKSLPGQININFDVVETDSDNTEDQGRWPNLPAMADKQPDSEARRQQFLKEVSKGISSATNYIVDINAHLPTIMRNPQVLTVGISESNVDEKSRGLLFWKPLSKDEANKMELCVAGLMRSSKDILLNPKKAIERVPRDELNIELQIGPTCENGLEIRIEGNQTRTDDFKETMMESDWPFSKSCLHEMAQGNKGLRGCQEAVALANKRDHAIVSVDITSQLIKNILDNAVQYASQNLLSDESIEIVEPRNAEKNTIDLEIQMSPDFKSAEATLHTSHMDIKFNPLDLSDTSFEEKLNKILDEQEEDIGASCTLDKTAALTFDNKTYPVKLGNCWHVMMTTYSQNNPDSPNELLPIPEEMQVAVLVRETKDEHKQVRIIMGDKEIEMQKSGDQLEVTLNGEKVHFSQHKSHRVQKDDETIIEIFALPDDSVSVMSDEYEMNVVYDGERIRLELSDEYRRAVRGLCGNYDWQHDNDFTTPKNCILRNPEEFVATYAMTQESCEGPAVENKQKAEQSKCIHTHHRQSNVISDREAGRPWTENRKWGYHHDHKTLQGKPCTHYHTKVIEEGEEICFTISPLPTCAKDCKPTEVKMKKYMLHCMPRNEISLQFKKRIEQGAHPDMTQRSVSKSHSYEVPLGCSAA